MTDFSSFVPKYIRQLAHASKSKPLKQAPSGTSPVRLNLNENPFGPSPLAIRAMQGALTSSHRYPEVEADDLHQEIASFHDVKPEQVLVTAGATELLGMLARALLGPGLNSITSAKSFIVYRLATQLTEGRLIELPTKNDGYDLDAIATAIDSNTRIIFIANPNNPTGTLLTVEEIDHFIERLPDHVLLVLDEAYADFSEYFVLKRSTHTSRDNGETPQPITQKPRGLANPELGAANTGHSRSLDYVKADRNVVLLKTFSKTHGLAGLRVGYGIGPGRLMSLFAPLRTIFSVSSLAQTAAKAALRDSEHIRRAVENNAQQSEVLSNGLLELGFRPPETWANFFYLELGQDASAFADRLRERGVVVQPLELWGSPTAIRVSIGTPEDNQQFLTAMRSLRG